MLTKTAVGRIVKLTMITNAPSSRATTTGIHKKTGSSSWDCAITVSFEAADGKSYTHTGTTRSQSVYNVGDTIKIYYNPSKPSSSSLSSDDLRLCGAAMVGGALIVVTIAWLYVWFTRVNKVAAAVSGASSIVSNFSGLNQIVTDFATRATTKCATLPNLNDVNTTIQLRRRQLTQILHKPAFSRIP